MEAQNISNARWQLYNNIGRGAMPPSPSHRQHSDDYFSKPKIDNTERYATLKAKRVDDSLLESDSRPISPVVMKVTADVGGKTSSHATKGVNDMHSTMNRKALSVDKLNSRRAPHTLERGCVSPDSACSSSLEPSPLQCMKSEISKDSGLGSPVDDIVDDFAESGRDRTLADVNSSPPLDRAGRGSADLSRRSRSRTPSHRHHRPSVSSSTRDSSLGATSQRVCTDLATQV